MQFFKQTVHSFLVTRLRSVGQEPAFAISDWFFRLPHNWDKKNEDMIVMKSGSWKLYIEETIRILSKNICVLTILKQTLHEVKATFSKQFFKEFLIFNRSSERWGEKTNVPSYVHKQVFCSFVNVEYFISKQSQTRAALKCKFPKVQSCSITIEDSMAQNKSNFRSHVDVCHKPDAQDSKRKEIVMC